MTINASKRWNEYIQDQEKCNLLGFIMCLRHVWFNAITLKKIKKNSKGLDMVFQTIDIDKDKSVQLYEFLCALFYIQQLDLSNLERAEKIFMQSWDRID